MCGISNTKERYLVKFRELGQTPWNRNQGNCVSENMQEVAVPGKGSAKVRRGKANCLPA